MLRGARHGAGDHVPVKLLLAHGGGGEDARGDARVRARGRRGRSRHEDRRIVRRSRRCRRGRVSRAVRRRGRLGATGGRRVRPHRDRGARNTPRAPRSASRKRREERRGRPRDASDAGSPRSSASARKESTRYAPREDEQPPRALRVRGSARSPARRLVQALFLSVLIFRVRTGGKRASFLLLRHLRFEARASAEMRLPSCGTVARAPGGAASGAAEHCAQGSPRVSRVAQRAPCAA